MSKILNDPVYGFITLPQGLVYELIEHPWFQRLRRISQLGLSGYVYPGALHTRFHHALGALHLMREAIEVLRNKGVSITDEELEAVSVAILLHDIGHGPFSHALEHTLVNVHHEALSMLFMDRLNQQKEGRMEMAIQIFRDTYPKKFLHQLVSGQLDMDRMDYLNRDSFFTGVSEGVIGYHRIIKMLHVVGGELVVEEKGIYSIEKFLIARRLMYWQVYLHKTAVCAEKMLIQVLLRARELTALGHRFPVSDSLSFFLRAEDNHRDQKAYQDILLHHFAQLDDSDMYSALKWFERSQDPTLSFLSSSLLHRRLFRIEWRNTPFEESYTKQIREAIEMRFPDKVSANLLLEGSESNRAYNDQKDEIKILYKDGSVRLLSEVADYDVHTRFIVKHYLCYPKEILIRPADPPPLL